MKESAARQPFGQALACADQPITVVEVSNQPALRDELAERAALAGRISRLPGSREAGTGVDLVARISVHRRGQLTTGESSSHRNIGPGGKTLSVTGRRRLSRWLEGEATSC